MQLLQIDMRERFQALFEASKYSSLRRLSVESECSPSQAGKIARGDFDGSKDGPSLFSTWRMTEQMGASLVDLMPPTYDHSERPGVGEFFAHYRGEQTMLRDLTGILEFCDIYAEPQMGRCKIISQGPRGLLAEKTGLVDVDRQQEEFDAWPLEKRLKTFKRQRRAWDAGALSEPVEFEGRYDFQDLNLKGWILHAACRAFTDDFEPRLVVYCEMLRQKQGSRSHQRRQSAFA